ncbi:SOS response-associated peptidase [Pontibacter korlensis]|uniref:SOS response-associated peptidase n=1 Tax=Pontibacter korlensis TaxID=400092 RepID=UPI000AE77A24|nr:SOS response-associated peptidase [Pontibacter korlensis]
MHVLKGLPWLSGDKADEHLLSLLRPYPSEELRLYPVSTLVNSPVHGTPDLLAPRRGACLASILEMKPCGETWFWIHRLIQEA